MKVILLQDVKALGKKGDVVEVSEGYARNMLLKKGMGIEATGKNMNDLKLQKANAEKIARETLEAAQSLGKEMEGKSIKIAVKTGEGGRIFGSVSSKEIAEEIKKQLGYEIDKKKIQIDNPIKALGVTNVSIKLHTKVTAELKVQVVEV
ncbi:MAG: 50S ribosomal protein L9 [Lachnospiraceae bacterium]|nr:50S ribosomal protein L9 [Lachnospiraceae bacterium]MDD7077929.1 50S ribosomal protein L9 [Lachnospiraceae bacterium]MDY3728882.1 50S ribosomal protein L9 [Candidatus Choladocola sp.]